MPPAAPPRDPLVIELGGDATPLREVLRRAGRDPVPLGGTETPRERSDGSHAVPATDALRARAQPGGDELGEPRDERRAPAEPTRKPPEPPPSAPRVAVLGAGETLYSLCARELGDALRWREVMALNGWTESDVRRLPAGQKVVLPR